MNQVRLDPDRLAAVRATGLLDSEVEEVFDRLTRLAVRVVGVPAAFISLVDENRDFYKSACGFGEPLASERQLTGPTFCHYTVERTLPLVIPDTASDEVYRDVPTVRTLGVRAYVGVPLVVSGQTIGAFCAIDMQPRAWTDDEVEVLVELAASAQREMLARSAFAALEALNGDLREQQADLERSNEQLRDQALELEAQTQELQAIGELLEERTEAAEAASEALTASELRYRTLANAVPVQVWTASTDGLLTFVNEQAVRYFNEPAEQLLGKGWAAFVHPDDISGALERWTQSLESGTPYEAEFRLRSEPMSSFHWHVARALPERDISGAVIGWVGSNTDVEGERAARAEAEAANSSKTQFLTNMSHELRTPLNAIGGYTQLLELGIQGPLTTEQLAYLGRIGRAQRHLLGLINGVLTYAKIGAGVVYYASEEVRIDELLTTCEALIAPQARERRLDVEFRMCDAALTARADGGKVQQILLNLLSNAVKFTDAGGRITVDCAAFGDGRVIVRVTDTGHGIAEGQLHRVFEPFVRVDAGSADGTGLGLAISRELAHAMGGDLTLVSEVGVGSVFTLGLPMP